MKKHLLIGLFAYWIICLLSPPASVQAMSNDNYTIEKQGTEIQTFKQPVSKPVQKRPEFKPAYSGKNYTVEADTSSSFIFTVSQESVNFGKLTATNPVTRLLYLTVEGPSNYQIFISENHPLVTDKNTIPDTTCDSGACSEITSAIWNSALTYGFGYHSLSMPEKEYKQFPDLSKKEQFDSIFQDKIIYKVNVAATQQPGAYSNTVTYMASPNY